jgi:hypothetical protein
LRSILQDIVAKEVRDVKQVIDFKPADFATSQSMFTSFASQPSPNCEETSLSGISRLNSDRLLH